MRLASLSIFRRCPPSSSFPAAERIWAARSRCCLSYPSEMPRISFRTASSANSRSTPSIARCSSYRTASARARSSFSMSTTSSSLTCEISNSASPARSSFLSPTNSLFSCSSNALRSDIRSLRLAMSSLRALFEAAFRASNSASSFDCGAPPPGSTLLSAPCTPSLPFVPGTPNIKKTVPNPPRTVLRETGGLGFFSLPSAFIRNVTPPRRPGHGTAERVP
mmetsp:Transcript_25341/g.60575  ORF Transcript_25341/g.60575 Transcript_25341/m.60575 type:complete len:221 (-) Transcript_25341:205-867(-)